MRLGLMTVFPHSERLKKRVLFYILIESIPPIPLSFLIDSIIWSLFSQIQNDSYSHIGSFGEFQKFADSLLAKQMFVQPHKSGMWLKMEILSPINPVWFIVSLYIGWLICQNSSNNNKSPWVLHFDNWQAPHEAHKKFKNNFISTESEFEQMRVLLLKSAGPLKGRGVSDRKKSIFVQISEIVFHYN